MNTPENLNSLVMNVTGSQDSSVVYTLHYKNGQSNSDVDYGGAGQNNVGVRKFQLVICLVLRHLCLCLNLTVSNMTFFTVYEVSTLLC
jgi:hypothetical protein